jgi:hypothetical protein
MTGLLAAGAFLGQVQTDDRLFGFFLVDDLQVGAADKHAKFDVLADEVLKTIALTENIKTKLTAQSVSV